MRTPVIETERLILRPMTVADAQHIFETWTSDTRVTKFMLYPTHTSVEVTRKWLADVEKGIDNDNFNWGIELKETGKLIGSGGLYKYAENTYTIGYNIAFDYWHKGYTSEAALAFVEFAKSIGAKKISSEHAVDNPNSGKVMEKIGMKFVRDSSYKCIDGREFQAKYYEMEL